MKYISRRSAVRLGMVAAAGLLIPKHAAYASEIPLSSSLTGEDSSGEVPIITDSAVKERLERSAQIWEECKTRALSEGYEIVTVTNPKECQSIQPLSTQATRVATTNEVDYDDGGPWINVHYYLSAMYDVDSNNRVSNLRNVSAVVTYGLYSPSIQLLGYTYTLADGGRTFVVRATLAVTCYVAGVARSAQWQETAFFYYTGVGAIY